MNKLTALHKLASAYHYLYPTSAPQSALNTLSKLFYEVRDSTYLIQLAPAPKCTEGFNPKGPTQL